MLTGRFGRLSFNTMQKGRTEDILDEETIPRGKQFWKEKGEFIWYTPSTGIWQSVWLEPVSTSSFKSIKVTSNIDKGTAEIALHLPMKHIRYFL